MTSTQLRSAFLAYFRVRNHTVHPSSSLVPNNDTTLLFTNAGMVPFKDIFLGRERYDCSRAVSSQRCVRAGGKHNDLENVGYTARHHTFFEMLGNFSFGAYFKKEAINYAWEFLTITLEIPAERLWVTVFEEDDSAADIWLNEVKVDPTRFSKVGVKDNFWFMGDVGPCGPCSEIFFDHGEHIPGGAPGTSNAEGDRYVEIWNLVFMQYNRAADGTMKPLPKPSVDTGMGLERLAAVLQNVHNNYEIDLFQGLLQTAAKIANTKDLSQSSLRVVVDHIRSCAFMVVDGVIPDNAGRGYVLRRIIRRAIRHGYRLGIREVFFYKLVAPLVKEMGDAYPELTAAQTYVEKVLKKEEQRFTQTLKKGMEVLEACVGKLKERVIPGDMVFLLYDTYGFPLDLTADYARENKLAIDRNGFDQNMQTQRTKAKAASRFSADYDQGIASDCKTTFVGYKTLQSTTEIIGLFKNGQSIKTLQTGEDGIVITNKTPFYAESGGQIGDVGKIIANDNIFTVCDTQKQGDDLFLHKGHVTSGVLSLKQSVQAQVDATKRETIALNHSATHLLHAALRQVLGGHVVQKGSSITTQRLRFDFSHFAVLSVDEIKAIDVIVNQQIRMNNSVSVEIMDKENALQAGAVALFGEKYGKQVRVLRIGKFSTELCGGTHVARSGDIGFFKIISEAGVATGVRRIEALTGATAIHWNEQRNQELAVIGNLVKAPSSLAPEKVRQLIEKNKNLEKQLEKLNSKLASNANAELASQAIDVGNIKVLATKLENIDNKNLRDTVDQLKHKLGSSAVVLAVVENEKIRLIAGVSKDQTKLLKAVDLVNFVATKVGGKGGGRLDIAQAGGNNPAALAKALRQVPDWVRQQLNIQT